jgi:hypothetical protein
MAGAITFNTQKGITLPTFTTTEKNAIVSPATGAIIFDTTLGKICVYNGSAWQTVTST